MQKLKDFLQDEVASCCCVQQLWGALSEFMDLWLELRFEQESSFASDPFALTSSCYSPMLKPIEAGLVCPGSEPGLGFVDQGLGCIDVVSQDQVPGFCTSPAGEWKAVIAERRCCLMCAHMVWHPSLT